MRSGGIAILGCWLLTTLVAWPVSAQSIQLDGLWYDQAPLPTAPTLDLGLHAAALRGDAFSTFETRLLAGGTAVMAGWQGWRPGLGIGFVWVDQESTTYLYHVRVERVLRAFGGVEPFLVAGFGGMTNRFHAGPFHESETDWLFPLGAGATWRPDAGSRWGLRTEVSDLLVRVEEPCGCVEAGDGPTPRTGRHDTVHNLAVSLGLSFRLGGR